MKPPRLPNVMRPPRSAKPYVSPVQGGIPAKPDPAQRDHALPMQGDSRMANGGMVAGRPYAKCG